MNENSTLPIATLYETAVKPTLNTAISRSQELAGFGKANLEAITASSRIWTAGVQDLTKQFAGTVNAAYADSVATFKAVSVAKSVPEAIGLQSTHGQAAIVKATAEAKKLVNASIQLTEQALAPLKARMTVAAEGFKKAA